MIVYSKKIIRFIHELKHLIKDILLREVGVNVSKDRFYDRFQNSYPIHLVIYNNKRILGYFDPNFYELGFHECLMYSTKEQLHQIIRHELAHYITFINHGNVQAHGAEFKTFCQRMGWGQEVYQATCCFEGGKDFHIEESPICRKIKKLMALATSSNEHEAEQAMIKSQQLLLKHHIDSSSVSSEEEQEKVYLKRIMKQKRANAKMRAIASILQTFFVSVVYSRGGEFTYLEILGNATNLEIAEYVAGFLNSELENLWNQAQESIGLKGAVSKNSFFFGLAKGYSNKIQALKREYSSEATQALVVLEKQLTDAKAMAYSRLSSSKSQASYCRESATVGEHMGKHLTISPAIQRSSSSNALLTYTRD